jgi:folate-binding protein YgfZ
MAANSPMIEMYRREEVPLLAYGAPTSGVFLVDRFAPIELEYAALRRSCVLLDLPSRGVVEVRGADRQEFLGRMLTQRVADQPVRTLCRSFWLNRKGRIDADVRVVELGDRTLLEVDVHVAGRVRETLEAFVIADDVVLRDVTEETHRLAVHGPGGPALIAEIAGDGDVGAMAEGDARVVAIAGIEAIVFRDDSTGDAGMELIAGVDEIGDVYLELLTKSGAMEDVDRESDDPVSKARMRRAGWHAYNVARIEAGTALFMIDFGPDTLPAESGVIESRIDFGKGCYLGQEVVARMHARGAFKQRLVGIRVEGEAQPATGSRIEAGGEVVGAVTSSTVSPMLGSAIVCFGMVKAGFVAPGTMVSVEAEGALASGVVQEGLRFWSR